MDNAAVNNVLFVCRRGDDFTENLGEWNIPNLHGKETHNASLFVIRNSWTIGVDFFRFPSFPHSIHVWDADGRCIFAGIVIRHGRSDHANTLPRQTEFPRIFPQSFHLVRDAPGILGRTEEGDAGSRLPKAIILTVRQVLRWENSVCSKLVTDDHSKFHREECGQRKVAITEHTFIGTLGIRLSKKKETQGKVEKSVQFYPGKVIGRGKRLTCKRSSLDMKSVFVKSMRYVAMFNRNSEFGL